MTGPVPDRPWRLTPGCGCLLVVAAVLVLAGLAVGLWGKP